MDSGRLTARQTRALRGGAGAAVATLVAATAHTVAGGGAPPAWLLLAVTLLAWPIAVGLTGRGPSVRRTALVVTATQVLLHAAFASIGTTDPVMTAHVHGETFALAVGSSAPIAVDPAMAVGHALAAALTVFLLAHGERMLRALADGMRELLPRVAVRPLRPAVPPLPAVPAPRSGAVALLHTPLSRRGPPA